MASSANIVNSWIAVGFLPMTGNAVNDPKVQFELGEGGAPEAEQQRMRDLYSDYCATREELAGMEFNVVVPGHGDLDILLVFIGG